MIRWVEKRKDIGLSLDVVEDHLLFINVNETQRSWKINGVEKLDPFRCAYVIFEDATTQDALGYLDWDTLFKACNYGEGGCISRDMLQTDWSGVLIFPWETRVAEEEEDNTPPPPKYTMCWSHTPMGDIRLDELENTCDPCIPVTEPTDNTLRALVAILDTLYYLKTGNFEKPMFRVDGESKNFFNCVRDLSEKQMVQMLRDNGLEGDRDITCAPTPLDIQCFMYKYTIPMSDGPGAVPSIMFKVPFEEHRVPPVYAGLECHLSWLEVKEWLWEKQQHYVNIEIPRLVYRDVVSNYEGDPIKYRDGQFKRLFGKRKEKIVKKRHKRAIETHVLADIEDLVEHASPPCLQHMLKLKKWYKDQERLHLARHLCSGEIALETADIVFERSQQYNENPKNTWQHKQVWEKGYTGCQCSVFIENEKNDIPDAIGCPLANEPIPQKRCVEEFAKRHPKKHRETDVLKRPYQWYLWYYKR
jgi:hypothetical protein